MRTSNLVKAALKEKAPELYAQLEKSGKLTDYVTDLADEISSQTVTMTQAQRVKGKWDALGPMECAARLKAASAMNKEIALQNVLDFPRDEASQTKPDATMSLDRMT